MSSCEKCWSDAHGDPYRSVADEYHRLIVERVGDKMCSPEERAGPDAEPCPECAGHRVLHQLTGECMADPRHKGTVDWQSRAKIP